MAKAKADGAETLFTKADYEQLRLTRRKLNHMLVTIDKAAACGIACDFIKQQRDEVDAQLAAIEQHFMTPAPG